MSDPVVKIWFIDLKDGRGVLETAFSGFWNDAMFAAATYPTEQRGHHALYHCDDEPSLLAVVVGYSSEDMGAHVHRELARVVPRLAEWVTDRELLVMEASIFDFPLDSGSIVMSFSESKPSNADSLPGAGRWAERSPSLLNPDAAVDPKDPKNPKKRRWLHIAPAEDADQFKNLGDVKRFSMVLESHIASQSAE
ncbi:hypothetical protein F4777DRAFT_171408 [Nemania sp. FL0916]|nr:hypothetical protein F4777DRAFT_171408 [Nemania sp. FL0916]